MGMATMNIANVVSSDSPQLGSCDPSMTYSQRLFHHTYASQNEGAHFMEFRLLQRINLVQLQNELSQMKGRVWTKLDISETDLKELRVKLREYGESPVPTEFFSKI